MARVVVPAAIHDDCLYDDEVGLDTRLSAFAGSAGRRQQVAAVSAGAVRSIDTAVAELDDLLERVAGSISP